MMTLKHGWIHVMDECVDFGCFEWEDLELMCNLQTHLPKNCKLTTWATIFLSGSSLVLRTMIKLAD